MRKALLTISCISFYTICAFSQKPCSRPEYRQFDFWIGEWEAFGINGQKAGDSKISVILDSCVILEEWTSASINRGIRYSGKSFNTYNRATQQWQQTYVDNVGASNEYLLGKFDGDKIVYLTSPFKIAGDTMAVRRLSFFNLGPDKVRQQGEILKGKGDWVTEFDLEYRRKK